jgi:hypothetical protein
MPNSFLSTWTVAGVWIAVITLLGILARQIVPWKKQVEMSEAQFRSDLIIRVRKLERDIESERAIHKAEQSLDRHMLGNITQCFDAMLMLVEMNPDRAADIIVTIKEMRGRQMKAEAEEKALIRAAVIAAVGRSYEDDTAEVSGP